MNMEGDEPKKTSFGFKKVAEKRDFRATGHRKFVKEASEAVEPEEDEIETVQEPKKKLVIPLPEDGGQWSQAMEKLKEEKEKKDAEMASAVPEGLKEDDTEAVKALLAESALRQQEFEEGKGLRTVAPAGIHVKENDFLEEGKFGEQATLDDYDDVPVEEFGAAMLRGMGMTEAEFQEMRQKEPVEVRPWPVGLGLGAAAKYARKNRKDGVEEEVELKRGVRVKIDSGSHRGLYGTVEGTDADRGTVLITLALGGETVPKSQVAVSVVSEDEYKKEAKVINRDTYDKYKKRDSWLTMMGKKEEGALDRRGDERGARVKKEKREERVKKESVKEEYVEKKVKKEKNGDSHEHRDSKDRRDKYGSERRRSSPPPKPRAMPWVQPKLRVRMISREYRGGKYYNNKLTVEDVPSPDVCVCMTDERRLLDDVDIRDLETIVPREPDAMVLVVKGRHRGKLGRIINRSKQNETVAVELQGAGGNIVDLFFDDVCHYVG